MYQRTIQKKTKKEKRKIVQNRIIEHDCTLAASWLCWDCTQIEYLSHSFALQGCRVQKKLFWCPESLHRGQWNCNSAVEILYLANSDPFPERSRNGHSFSFSYLIQSHQRTFCYLLLYSFHKIWHQWHFLEFQTISCKLAAILLFAPLSPPFEGQFWGNLMQTRKTLWVLGLLAHTSICITSAATLLPKEPFPPKLRCEETTTKPATSFILKLSQKLSVKRSKIMPG